MAIINTHDSHDLELEGQFNITRSCKRQEPWLNDHCIKRSNRRNLKKVGLVSNKSDAPQRTTMSNSLSAQEFRPHGRANNTPSQTLYLRIATQVLFKDKRNGMVKRTNACSIFWHGWVCMILTWTFFWFWVLDHTLASSTLSSKDSMRRATWSKLSRTVVNVNSRVNVKVIGLQLAVTFRSECNLFTCLQRSKHQVTMSG